MDDSVPLIEDKSVEKKDMEKASNEKRKGNGTSSALMVILDSIMLWQTHEHECVTSSFIETTSLSESFALLERILSVMWRIPKKEKGVGFLHSKENKH